MIHRAFDVREWTVDILFAHGGYDQERVLNALRDYGAPESSMRQAESLMRSGPNCGFTFSNGYRRCILTWVGRQVSGAEWVNTTVHEIVHVAMAIAIDQGIDPYTEELAYLIGDITERLSDLLCALACDHCREENFN